MLRTTFPFMGHKTKKVFLSTVSGAASTKPELITWFDKNVPSLSIITTKSFQVLPNPGNREPVICEAGVGNFGNSVGLKNPGMEVALSQIKEVRKKGLRTWLNISLSADNAKDFLTLIKAFDSEGDSLELNFSCPHAKAGFGASIGSDIAIAQEYVRYVCENYKERKSLLFIKLTPNVPNIGEIAKAVIESGADGISAINTTTPEIHKDSWNNPILNNPLGGKGGKSGSWVFERALEAIKEIRTAVGDNVPIMGMGGVSTSEEAALLVENGADTVGIGTALARVDQNNWPSYFEAIEKEANSLLSLKNTQINSKSYLSTKPLMEYSRYKVVKTFLHDESTMVITLDGSLDNFKAGEFVFLRLPEIGEKPFSVAKANPLSFIIKKRGFFTSSLFDIKEGDFVYLRGTYGKPVTLPSCKKALIIAGGTGEAVAYPLGEELDKQKIPMTFMVGTSVPGNKGIMEEDLSKLGKYLVQSDNGKPGRILDSLDEVVNKLLSDGTKKEDLAVFLIGPEIFMRKGAEALIKYDLSSDQILVSMEKNTMCGIGLCGECSCGGKLSCKNGTFMTYTFLKNEGIF
ncbi:MAG: dihydroorotate dehydrogenase [Sphaerochaetaceae bacterium]|nr:dihydroorotate dehydrogenase [Sphaerochaetaceae bacterium]